MIESTYDPEADIMGSSPAALDVHIFDPH